MVNLSGIYQNGIKHDLVKSGALYESQYEIIVKENLLKMFPDIVLVDFKKTVSSEFGTAQADFAIIRKDYKQWWVVEVELAHHSFEGHVWPQVNTLNNAYYGYDEACYLNQKNPVLELESLIQMMRGEPPKVIVIVDRDKSEWKRIFDLHDIGLITMQPYLSVFNKYILLVDGSLDLYQADIVTEIKLAESLGSFWKVQAPISLAKYEKEVPILIYGEVSVWTKVQTRDQLWLVPPANLNLDKTHYKIVSNNMYLELI